MSVLTIETTDRELGQLIRGMRKARKIKQSELAEALGISRSAVANIEGGTCGVLMKHIVATGLRCGYEIVITVRPVTP
jgi:DNA-binding XRE family transcriptional regulator